MSSTHSPPPLQFGGSEQELERHVHDAHHVFRLLGVSAAHVLVGFALGAILAKMMYKRSLHWTWTAIACVIVTIADLLVPSVVDGLLGHVPGGRVLGPLGLFVLTLKMALRGRRWYGEDSHMGGPRGSLAEHQLTPIDAMRAVETWLESHHQAERRVVPTNEKGMLLGHDDKGRPLYITDGAKQGEHIIIVGAPGEGKTVTETTIAVARILRGDGGLILEGKSDDFMLEQVTRAATAVGKQVILWTAKGPWAYNTLAEGSYTERADRLLASERPEPDGRGSHFTRRAHRYLLNMLRALELLNIPVTLPEVAKYLHPNLLEELLQPLASTQKKRTEDSAIFEEPAEPSQPVLSSKTSVRECARILEYLKQLSDRSRGEIADTLDTLAIAAESDIRPWLDPSTPEAKTFTLREAIENKAIVYFRLEADARPKVMPMLTAAIVQDLGSAANAIQGRNARFFMIMDEFTAIPSHNITTLTARARSAGITVVLGTQELTADLSDDLRNQVIGTAKVTIVHCQQVPESAEYLSKLAGTKWVRDYSEDDHLHRKVWRWIKEPRIDPDDIQSLPLGWAAVILRGARKRVCTVKVLSSEHYWKEP